MIADRRRSRLHEEDFLAAYGFEKLHHYVAVWILVHDTSTDLTAQLGRNQSCHRRLALPVKIANSLFTLARAELFRNQMIVSLSPASNRAREQWMQLDPLP
jgi:hypothetical protein